MVRYLLRCGGNIAYKLSDGLNSYFVKNSIEYIQAVKSSVTRKRGPRYICIMYTVVGKYIQDLFQFHNIRGSVTADLARSMRALRNPNTRLYNINYMRFHR